MKSLRFSYNIFGIHSRDDFAQNCRRAERQGYDTLLAAEQILAAVLFIGTVEQMAEQVLRNRERYGLTYYPVHGPFADTFAPVIERVAAIRA